MENNFSQVRIFVTSETCLDFTYNEMRVGYWDWLYGQVMDINEEEIEDIIVDEDTAEIVFTGDYLTLYFSIE